jgi:hypothetical protein
MKVLSFNSKSIACWLLETRIGSAPGWTVIFVQASSAAGSGACPIAAAATTAS